MKKIISTAILIIAFSANADPQWCNGKINHVWLKHEGSLFIHSTWRDGDSQICNINAEWKGISVEVCKGWLSLTQTANISQRPVTVYYNDVISCSAIEAYGAAPSPSYVMLNKD